MRLRNGRETRSDLASAESDGFVLASVRLFDAQIGNSGRDDFRVNRDEGQ